MKKEMILKKTSGQKMDNVSCEWCDLNYPVSDDGELAIDYFQVNLFGKKTHIICRDCYKHLKVLSNIKDVIKDES